MQGFWFGAARKMSVGTYPQIKNDFAVAQNLIKISSVMPFVFNVVKLCFVTINEKPWTYTREVHRALGYDKSTKAADIIASL